MMWRDANQFFSSMDTETFTYFQQIPSPVMPNEYWQLDIVYTRSATNSKFRRKKHWSFTKEPCVEGFTGGYVHSLVDQILS